MHWINWRPAAVAALVALTAVATPAAAQEYPSRPMKIVVPFPPGGTADVVARVIGAKLATLLAQPGIVENRVGANGNIGTELAARAVPDGYTVLAGNTANLIVNPALYPSIPFDTVKDFTPVAAVASSPNVLVVIRRIT